jgi:hypothetical protein
MEENSLKLHGKGQIFGMASTCADPGFARTRAPLSMAGLKMPATDTLPFFYELRSFRSKEMIFPLTVLLCST